MKYRTNLQRDKTDTVLKKPGKPGFFLSDLIMVKWG
ncbi:hypothetical protein BSNT_08385 [Bacillus subtilis subsp. natto BEST195]|nr:hypothetical protein BSNT_08385 [Bacillus subtilis subsp. natto BEST195]